MTWGEPGASGGGGGEDGIRAAGALDCACDEHPAAATASIAAPNITYDFPLPANLGTQDVAQVLRLNDK